MTVLNDEENRNKGLLSTIIKAGLLAGLFDIVLAFLYAYIKRGTSPQTVLQYVAKTALGETSITDPTMLTITGLLIHFAIAMVWTILFFMIYRALKLVKLNKFVTAVIYGAFVWAMMSMVILPLWNDRPFSFNLETSTINALILIVAIGLPLSLVAKKFYTNKA